MLEMRKMLRPLLRNFPSKYTPSKLYPSHETAKSSNQSHNLACITKCIERHTHFLSQNVYCNSIPRHKDIDILTYSLIKFKRSAQPILALPLSANFIQGYINFDHQSFRHYSAWRINDTHPSLLLQGLSNQLGNKLLLRSVRRTPEHHDHSAAVSISSSDFKHRVKDRTKTIFHGKISKLKKSIIIHKCRFKDKLKAHHQISLHTVRKLQRTWTSKKENIKTIPNLLTTMRMASAPLLAYLVVHDYFGTACTIFVLAGFTDLMDGFIARNFKNQRTALGTALDPLADKLLVSFLGISLTSAGLIPVPMTVLILTRDVGLILATFYIRYISLPPPKTLSRYFDVSLVTAKLYPSTVSKINTGLQLSYVAMTLASPVFNFVDHPLLQGLMYLTAVTTAISGVDYVLTWRQRLKIIQK